VGLKDFARWAYRTVFGAPAANVLQPPVYRIYVRLRFLDPDGTIRNFPANYPVQVRFGDGATAVRVNSSPPMSGDGIVAVNARTAVPWQFLTLEFNSAEVPYIVCEPLGSPPMSPPQFQPASGLAGATTHGERFFSLPPQWELRQGDWSPPPNFPDNGRWESPPGRIRHTTAPPNDIHIGTPAVPIDFVLVPHWHYARFEYYDRYYGNANLDSPPRPAHQQRISTPPIALQGFRNNVNAAGSPPDTHSNWAVDLGGNSLLQALPFILRRDATGAALSPPSGSQLGLRFTNPANTFVYSATDQSRVIAVSPPPAAPGPDRLRYYDLPTLWKSRGYYTRRVVSSPPAAGKFFPTLTAGEIAGAEQRNSPLVFSLDDMVLCTGNPATGGLTGVLTPTADTASSPPSGRVAIFNHRFDARVGTNSNPQGVYKMLAPPGPDAFDLPRSDVTVTKNYLYDYPDWSRMVTARGNVHDVFDKRTADGMSPPNVVGARAAVRWVDATAPFPGIPVFTWGGAAWVPQADGRPIPGRMLNSMPPAVSMPAANPLFAMGPFHEERTAQRYSAAYSVGSDEGVGRYDIVLLRCCDVQEGNEVAVNLNYLRSSFDFTGPLPPLPVTQPVYAQNISQNVGNRWSGNDPGINTFRASFTPGGPSPPSPPVPLRVDAVWFPQAVRLNHAHFNVVLWNQPRDNRLGQLGTGNSGPGSYQSAAAPSYRYAAAHETGHMGALPDEYNERWSGTSYGQISLRQNLPGDPYEPDGRTIEFDQAGAAMMNGNRTMRNRYFWHNAEWVHGLIGTPLKVIYQDIGGTLYDNYWLPQHATAGRTFYPWPLLGLRDQSISPPAPPPPSPPVAYPQQWGRYDLFLYALGRDQWSSSAINAHASAAAPFDAVLIIALKLTCSLLPSVIMTSPPVETAQRKQILQAIAGAARMRFNNTWGFSGVFSPPNWTINKGLIQLVPQFVVENYSPPWDAAQAQPLIPLARGDQNTFGINYQLRVESSPPASRWSPPGRRLEMEAPAWANLDPLFAAQIPRMLGINTGLAALSPPDLEPIVRLILPGATVRRLP
jgi:hypothetical protein